MITGCRETVVLRLAYAIERKTEEKRLPAPEHACMHNTWMSAVESGPLSSPIQPSGMESTGTTWRLRLHYIMAMMLETLMLLTAVHKRWTRYNKKPAHRESTTASVRTATNRHGAAPNTSTTNHDNNQHYHHQHRKRQILSYLLPPSPTPLLPPQSLRHA